MRGHTDPTHPDHVDPPIKTTADKARAISAFERRCDAMPVARRDIGLCAVQRRDLITAPAAAHGMAALRAPVLNMGLVEIQQQAKAA